MTDNAGALLVAQRKIVPFTCLYCKKKGTGRVGKKYCDDTCKQALRAAKQKAARAEKKAK